MNMNDYAQPILDIKALRQKAYSAMQDREWEVASQCADKIIVAAQKIKMYSADKLQNEAIELQAY
jgi:hypothetical protein